MRNYTFLLGFWSAVIITLLNIGSTSLRFVMTGFDSFLLGFPVVIVFVVLMGAVHSCAPEEKKIFGLLGVVFSAVAATLLGFNYYFMINQGQLGVLPEMLLMTNPHSLIWVIEVLGYGFMGIATLAAAPVFAGGKLEQAVFWLFVANGVLGIGGIVAYAANASLAILMGGLLAWDIVFPVMTLLSALVFRQKMKSMVKF
jgi:hypothetical protein